MYHYFYLIGTYTEQPFGFNHFETFVHHGSGVYGDFGSHIPVGMFQGLCFGYGGKLLHCAGAERAAGSCQYNFFDRVVCLSGQTLEHSRVLGVYRQDWSTAETCQVIDEFACHDQCLFVGKGYYFTCADGVHGRFQSGITHHGGQHYVNGSFRYNLAQGFLAGIYFDRQVGKSVFQLLIFGFVCYYHCFRLELTGLGNQIIHPVVGCQHVGFVPVRMFLYDLQCLRTDRTGRAKYGNLFLHQLYNL